MPVPVASVPLPVCRSWQKKPDALMNEIVTLQQILDNREARADFQKILLRGYGSALVEQ